MKVTAYDFGHDASDDRLSNNEREYNDSLSKQHNINGITDTVCGSVNTMEITTKQEFTITMTGEELQTIRKYLFSGFHYHINFADDFSYKEQMCEDPKQKKEYTREYENHSASAVGILNLLKALPTPNY